MSRVAPSTVGDETGIRPHVIVAQFDDLHDTGSGTGGDLDAVVI